MKFQELEARATPAPWTVDAAQPSWPVHDRASDGSWFTTTEEANARLAAHCRNNFGKALEALREIADMIQYETSFESPAYKRCWALIAELEDVQT